MAAAVSNWQMQSQSVPERFSAYAWAYLRAATRMCQNMKANSKGFGFPDACVVLLLAAHSVELFLKGAILRRNPTCDIGTHRLDDLHREFDRLFPEPDCRWELPFGSEYLGFTEQEALALAKAEAPPSIRYRYPTDNAKKIWSGIHSFEPETFLLTLTDMESAYFRIERVL